MEETAVEEQVPVETVETPPKRNWGRVIIISVFAILVTYGHYKYVSILFDNDRNFQYLSQMEREMSLKTEMGFYYSYYKTLVEEQPFVAGVTKLMYDRMMEYPKEINALNRFNIHPEVLLGAVYRYFEPYLNTTANVQCLMVDRSSDGLPAAESCSGLGVPILFYLEAIWWLAGVTVAGVFLHAILISESILGGLVAVTHYFANHAEATRVHWAPNERENFAWPLLVAQGCLVAAQLRGRRGSHAAQLQVAIFFLNCSALLFWQFTQFIFLTQIAIFFVMEQLRIIDTKTFCIFLQSHFCGLHMAVLILQGNDMLKSSLYVAFFFTVSLYCLFFSSLRVKVENTVDFFVEAWLVLLRIGIVACSSLYIKKLLNEFLDVQEDSHIWELLYSKFSDYKSFHTLMYSCSEVYDFLPWKSVRNLLESFLLVYVVFNGVNVVVYWFKSASEVIDNKEDVDETTPAQDDDDSGIENNANTDNKLRRRKVNTRDKINDIDELEQKAESKDWFVQFVKRLEIEPHVFYGLAQTVVYGIMAVLIMRLKLLFVTQMCIVSALLMNTKYLKYIVPDRKYLRYAPVLWMVLLVPVGIAMFRNVLKEMSFVGQYSDPPLEDLLHWIINNTGACSAFAGSMPLMATVAAAARRPVVLHPHYEHREARQRTYAVYKVYGRFTAHELYQELTKLRATYLIVEWSYCYGKSNNNCTFDEVWSAEDPSLLSRRQPPLCKLLLRETVDHFYPVYRSEAYHVFRVHDMSVRYMPRSFDT